MGCLVHISITNNSNRIVYHHNFFFVHLNINSFCFVLILVSTKLFFISLFFLFVSSVGVGVTCVACSDRFCSKCVFVFWCEGTPWHFDVAVDSKI